MQKFGLEKAKFGPRYQNLMDYSQKQIEKCNKASDTINDKNKKGGT